MWISASVDRGNLNLKCKSTRSRFKYDTNYGFCYDSSSKVSGVNCFNSKADNEGLLERFLSHTVSKPHHTMSENICQQFRDCSDTIIEINSRGG